MKLKYTRELHGPIRNLVVCKGAFKPQNELNNSKETLIDLGANNPEKEPKFTYNFEVAPMHSSPMLLIPPKIY
eukprot:snap_masked-scaffold_61-processed-gene-0.39-mRNA-1 protein AED:1.00 eAED:1.00 QI:0/0/0/0/1/1/2/0/72